MAKLTVPLYVKRPNHQKAVRTIPIVDSGSDLTLFPRWVADKLGLRPKKEEDIEFISMMGMKVPFWFSDVDLYVQDTDCLAGQFHAGFAIGGSDGDIPYAIVGTDFLQVTGSILDFGRDRHSIACDPRRRGTHSDKPVMAICKRPFKDL